MVIVSFPFFFFLLPLLVRCAALFLLFSARKVLESENSNNTKKKLTKSTSLFSPSLLACYLSTCVHCGFAEC